MQSSITISAQSLWLFQRSQQPNIPTNKQTDTRPIVFKKENLKFRISMQRKGVQVLKLDICHATIMQFSVNYLLFTQEFYIRMNIQELY